MKRFLLFLTTLLMGASLFGQTAEEHNFAQKAHLGMNQLYDMKFAEAEKTIFELKKSYPLDPAPDFLMALNLWWQISANTADKSHDQLMRQYLESSIKKADNLENNEKNKSETVFIRLAAWGYIARLQALRGDYFGAVKSSLKCIPDHGMSEKYPAFKYEFMYAEGLYNYYAEWYPEHNPIVKPLMLFFPKGNKTLGLVQIHEAKAHENYSQVEASLALRDIYVDSELQPQPAVAVMEDLVRRYPDNYFFIQRLGITLVKAGKNAEALARLQPLIKFYNRSAHAAPVTLAAGKLTTQLMEGVYYAAGLAEARLNPGSDSGKQYLVNANQACVLNGDAGSELHSDVLLALGKYYDHNGNRNLAIVHYTQVVSFKSNNPAKKEAQRYIKVPATGL